MPLDVLGRTRATLKHSTSPPRPTGLGNLLKLLRDGDRLLQLLIFNEEFLVSACHQRALITSLPFVHTARRSYRLNDPVRPPDWGDAFGSPDATLREAVQTLLFRGRRSRNKVSVCEPAEGSFAQRYVLFSPATHHTVPSVLSSGIFSNSSMLRSLCNVCEVFYLLRRRMPWLEDR